MEDFHAFPLKQIGIFHILFLVKTSFQFEHRIDLLSVLHGIDQSIYHLRVFGRTVKSYVNALHARIDGCFPQEIDKMLECMIGIIQENIPSGYDFENTRKERYRRVLYRPLRSIQEVGTHFGKLHQVFHHVVTFAGRQHF